MFGVNFSAFYLLGVVLACAQAQLLDPEASVTIDGLGTIQGLTWLTYNIPPRKFHVFHGIPYAHDPRITGRFSPSVLRSDALTDDGTPFMALNPLVVCPQGFTPGTKKMGANNTNILNILKNGLWKWTEDYRESEETDRQADSIIKEDEDCLVINVNTPKIPKEGENLKYPVIFFIHGGSSTQVFGSPFMGHKFLEHDVVLVTINYRLGVLGALNLQINDAPGNAAMYDSITALKWVQEHIHNFGGDKDRVVLYGHSAGSMMVSHLLLSPLAKDLFHGVIGSSGSVLAPWGTAEENSLKHHLEVCFHAECFAEWEIGYDETPTDERIRQVYECMNSKPENELRRALSRYSGRHQELGGLGFDAKVPSVQGPKITIEKFLEEMPAEILRQQKQNNVSLIMGANRHDGSFAFEDIYKKYLLKEGRINNTEFMRNDLLPQLIKTLKATDKSGAFQHIIAKTYFGDAIKNGDFQEMLPGLIDLTSIWGFKAPAWELVEKHAKMNSNSYYYAFDFAGFWSTCDMGGESDIPCGVPHIDDMSMTFQIFPLINEDFQVAKRMVQYFVNFAYYGTPNNPSDNSILHWDAYEPMTHPFLKIDTKDSIGHECREAWIDNSLEIV